MGKAKRLSGLRLAARDLIWLYDCRGGLSVAELAARDGVSVDAVRDAIHRGEGHASPGVADLTVPPDVSLLPLFPVGGLTPSSHCPHHGPIRPGEPVYCVVCHATGFDTFDTRGVG
jgi:hypothetical protein